MNEEKKWFQSKTIWASLAVVIAAVANQFGFDLGPEELTDVFYNAVIGVSGVVAIFGRLTAKKAVTG